MKLRLYLFFSINVVALSIFSQVAYEAHVVDESSGEPLFFALIKGSNNNIQIDNHNNSINMNNINQKNADNSEANKNKIILDYTEDKNYNNAMKLRNILDNEKKIVEEENSNSDNSETNINEE